MHRGIMSGNSTLSLAERELVFDLAHKLTGTMEVQSTRHEIVITNVARRMQAVSRTNLLSYLNFISESESELAHFISAVTIHTTGWFREMPHYKAFERELSGLGHKLAGRKIRLLSAACSTGEELYSFGLILELIRKQYPTFDYELIGVDVDPISVQKASAGFYKIDDLSPIPHIYRPFLLSRFKFGERTYLIEPEIRRRTKFFVGSIVDPETLHFDPFDYAYCRNALIYFSEEKVNTIITNLLGLIKPEGLLTLGHSETIDSRRFNLVSLGASTYRNSDASLPKVERPMRVLCVDDSAAIRLWLSNLLGAHGIKTVTADTTEAATDLLRKNDFDLITLDLNMPGKSGTQWLGEQRATGLTVPVIVVTEVNADQAPNVLESLSGLSQDYVNKTQLGANSLEFIDRVTTLVKAHRNRLEAEHKPFSFSEFTLRAKVDLFQPDVILAGASTGGTDALCQFLANMPSNCPPIVIVQHIPKEFAPAFLERLAKVTGLVPDSPEKGKELEHGRIYLPVIDAHVGLRLHGDKINVYYSYAEKVSGHRPSVDYLFQAASFLPGKKVLATLLTGMGRDGAQGLLDLKRMGAITLAQDERSSVVWGMPGEAVRLGAPVVVGNLRELRELLFKAIRTENTKLPPRKAG